MADKEDLLIEYNRGRLAVSIEGVRGTLEVAGWKKHHLVGGERDGAEPWEYRVLEAYRSLHEALEDLTSPPDGA